MHRAMKALPVVEDYGDGFCSRLVVWGGMIVSYETFPKGVDATPLFKSLSNDMCQAPLGHVLTGRVRIKRADGDAVLKTGDVYYLEPGHVPVFEETPRFSNSVRRRSTSRQLTWLPRTWLQRKQRRAFGMPLAQSPLPKHGIAIGADRQNTNLTRRSR